jgi:16S rRNA processing protein RimM
VDEPAVVVGVITKAHGLRGEVAVQVRSDNPDRFVPGSTMSLPGGRTLTVDGTHVHGKLLLVRFAEVPDRTAAEGLRGLELSVPESALPELAEGEYWPFQLEGCAVITEAGRGLGTLVDVIPNPANDLWVARADDGTETLVPALRSVIVDVDVEGRCVRVREIPGLTAPDDDGDGTDP